MYGWKTVACGYRILNNFFEDALTLCFSLIAPQQLGNIHHIMNTFLHLLPTTLRFKSLLIKKILECDSSSSYSTTALLLWPWVP
jgi:hypothetical protein